MQLYNNLDANNVAKVINLLDPTNPQDAATMAWVLALVEGNNWKDNARVAAPVNVNLSTPGTTIDGVTMATNDRVVLANQTDPKQNGIYIYNGASTTMTRSSDANTASELKNAVVVIDEGTSNGGLSFRQITVNPVLGTSDIVFISFMSGVSDATTSLAGKIEIATQGEVDAGTATNLAVTPDTLAHSSLLLKKYVVTVGDNSSTSIAVTHNFGTTGVHVQVFKASGNKEMVLVDIERTNSNTITLKPISAPATNSLEVVVIG